jgi:tripartite-type tricarboxylate transporter receptor subunit TctC
VPAGTPPAAIAAINAGFNEVLKAPEVQKRLLDSGFDPRGQSPAEFAAFVQNETDKFAKVISLIGLQKQ